MTPKELYEQLIKEIEQTEHFDVKMVLDFVDRAHYLGVWEEKEAWKEWLARYENR